MEDQLMVGELDEGSLTFKVAVTEMKLFREFLRTVQDIVKDDRIPKEAREEYAKRLNALLDKYENGRSE